MKKMNSAKRVVDISCGRFVRILKTNFAESSRPYSSWNWWLTPAVGDWNYPVKTLLGCGRRNEIPYELKQLNKVKPLIVTDPGF